MNGLRPIECLATHDCTYPNCDCANASGVTENKREETEQIFMREIPPEGSLDDNS